MNTKEKILAATIALSTGVSGVLVGNKTKYNPVNTKEIFSQNPTCNTPMSITGNMLSKDRTQWQVIVNDPPTNYPCFIGPLKAIMPSFSKINGNDPQSVVPQRFYVYVENGEQ